MTDVPLELELPSVQPALPPDTGRGQLKLTDVDAKLAGWRCEGQLTLDDAPSHQAAERGGAS